MLKVVMDLLLLSLIIIVFGTIPLHFKSQQLLIFGLIAFGFLVSQITGQELVTQAADQTVIEHNLSSSLLLLVFSLLPPLVAVWTTKGKTKSYTRRILAVGLTPAIIVTAWSTIILNLPLEVAADLTSGPIHGYILIVRPYLLWSATVLALLELHLSRAK